MGLQVIGHNQKLLWIIYEKVIMSSSNKSCMHDTPPMWLCKDNASIMSNVLKDLVNMSFCNGEFPSQLREAIVCPVLKKDILDKNVLQNYRPVSNIRYYSKIMEKIAAAARSSVYPWPSWGVPVGV